MKNELMTDFSVDKENNTIKVRREFMAPLKHVWAAWTEKELLDQWWHQNHGGLKPSLWISGKAVIGCMQ